MLINLRQAFTFLTVDKKAEVQRMPAGPGSPLAEKPGFLKPRLPGRRSWAPAGLACGRGSRAGRTMEVPVAAPLPGGAGQGTQHHQLETNFYFVCWSGRSMATG